MTDDQHGEGTPRGGGRWDPLPQGDYDDGATAFVNLPEGGIDALLASQDSPLAAPGHGYVPPQITVAPATTAGTDPAATGTWPVAGAPVDGAQWHDPNASGQDTSGGDRFTYQPDASGQWEFQDTGEVAHPEGPQAPGHDVTGQWSIPVAGGDLPDESGEFTTSALVEQWGGTPPPTLPGGAAAPWATEQSIGQPWGPGTAERPADHGQGPAGEHGHGSAHGHPAAEQPYGEHMPPHQQEPALARPYVDQGEPYRQDQDAHAAQQAPEYRPEPGYEHEHAPVPGAEPAGHARQDTGQYARQDAGDHTSGQPAPADHAAPRHAGDHAAGQPAGQAPAGQAPQHPADAYEAAPSAASAEQPEPSPHAPAGGEAPEDALGGADEAAERPAEAAAETAGTTEADGAPEDPEDAATDAAPQAPGEPESQDADAAAAESADASEAADASGTETGPSAAALDEDHPLASYVLRVNGTDRPVGDAWIGESLLYVLRERLGLAGAKDGCSQGECGACNVQVDGRLVASCLVPAVTAAGSEVRTVEGLASDGQPSDVQRALARCGAVQCGFCVPGMAMTVHDLLEGNPAPTELETRQALCGNLCRCSGYRGVVEAVKEVVAEREAHRASAASDAEAADEARIPHQAGPGAGGVNSAAFDGPQPPDRGGPHDQSHGQDGGHA